MNKNLFLLFIFPFYIFSNLVYKYEDITGNQKNEIIWTIEKEEKDLKITGEDNISTTILTCSENYDISKFSYKSKIEPTEYLFSLEKNILSAEGKIKSNSISKNIPITLPWIQQFGFGLKPFILSKNRSLKFCLLNPKDFLLQKMVAIKKAIKPITVLEKKYDAQKVTVTLQGFKSMFWKAQLWFDVKTGDLIKYVANSGPNTPISTILLVSIEKEGIFQELKNSFFKEKEQKK